MSEKQLEESLLKKPSAKVISNNNNTITIHGNGNSNSVGPPTPSGDEASFASNSDEYMDEEDADDEEDDDEEDDSDEDSDDDDAEDEDESDMDHESPAKMNRKENVASVKSTKNGSSKSLLAPKSDTVASDGTNSTKTKKTSGLKTVETPSTYIPTGDDGVSPEELEYDESAYIMYHKAECGYPCLSFDIIEDTLGNGDSRSNTYPQSVYLVAGTQAPKVHANKLLVMKMSNLSRMKEPKKKRPQDSDEEDESESESEAEDESTKDDPELLAAQVPHDGSINRVRVCKLGSKSVAATWSELGHVFLWDLSRQLNVVEDNKQNDLFNKSKSPPKHIFKFSGHRVEGFALDWSPTNAGFLASGDCNKNVHIWRPLEAFSWKVDAAPLHGHTASVEDIQWSPSEANVLATCSVDKSIRIWDIRSKPSSACMITVPDAHNSDINVLSWNKKDAAFVLSGGDDGAIKTWDLRMFANKSKVPTPIATFGHHTKPITSIEWHPSDSTVFAASADDNQITLWDLAVEKDDDEEEEDVPKVDEVTAATSTTDESDEPLLNQLPPQLLFIHQGQNEVKEIHWHPQIDGLVISTALSGFDIFRTVSV